MDLWHAAPPREYAGTGDTPLLQRAVDFLVPYVDPSVPWPHEQLGSLDRGHLVPVLLRADRAYGGYEEALIGHAQADHLTVLRLRAEAASDPEPVQRQTADEG